MKPQEPTITKVDSPTHETVERHPAYGNIVLNRATGRATLYGSDFTHQNFMTLSIHRSAKYRSLSNDWHHAEEELIEVWMTEAQWATFVSSVHQGGGVPCTLVHLAMKLVPGIISPKTTRIAQFGQELRARFDRAKGTIEALRQRIKAGKGGGESLKLLDGIEREMVNNAEFTAKQFDEHMEETVEKAKVEVNAYITRETMRAGLPAGASPIAIAAKAAGMDCPICHGEMHDGDCR